MATEDKSLRVIPFDGKRASWHAWSVKFKARARVRGYLDILLDSSISIPKESEIDALRSSPTDEDKAKVKIFDRATKAFDELILSIDHSTPSGRVAFSLVESSCGGDHPNGNVKIAWQSLSKRFEPQTITELTNLEQKFYKSELTSCESDPDVWFAQLENWRTRIKALNDKSAISDHVMTMHILSHLPNEYENTIENAMDNVSTLGLEGLKDKIHAKYSRIMNERTSTRKSRNAEKALLASALSHATQRDTAFAAYIKQFKGTCRNCGKYGHKSDSCPDKKTSTTNSSDGKQPSGGRFNGKCHYCGIYGHKKIDCKKLRSEIADFLVRQSDSEDSEAESCFDMQDLAAACDNEESDDVEDGYSDTDFVLMALDDADLEFNTSTSGNTTCDDGTVCTASNNTYPSTGEVSVSITNVSHFESSEKSSPDHYHNNKKLH